jgi:hypothetical protein
MRQIKTKLQTKKKSKMAQVEGIFPLKIYNKLEDNYHLSNKKALFLNMRYYYEAVGKDPYAALPLTFHVKEGLEDPEYVKFCE